MHNHIITLGIICISGQQENFDSILKLLSGNSGCRFVPVVVGDYSAKLKQEVLAICPDANFFKLTTFNMPICRQIILDNSRSEFVSFCLQESKFDSDDLLLMFEELQANSDLGVVFASDKKNIDGSWNFALARRSALTLARGFPVELSPLGLQEKIIMKARFKHVGYEEAVSKAVCVEVPSFPESTGKDVSSLLYKKHDLELCQNELLLLDGKQKFWSEFYSTGKKIEILLLHDREGWAWWHRSHNIKKYISSLFNVEIKHFDDDYNEDQYDFVVCFDAYFYERVKQHVKDWRKLIVGCSNGKLVEATRHICSFLPHAGVVTNFYAGYSCLKSDTNAFCCQNGVDEEVFYPALQNPAVFKACWVGNPNHLGQKGLDIIEQACKVSNVPLIISNRELGDSYTHAELRDHIYHNASVYLCASEAEGTPNPALEAMACGLPVISTPVGNMVEMIVDGYNGFLVERDVRSFARALKKLKSINQFDLRKNTRWAIENGWLWRQQVRKYEQMFFDLLASNSVESTTMATTGKYD